MTPKDLVVFLEEEKGVCNRLEYAARLAATWQAHLIATFVAKRFDGSFGQDFARGPALADMLSRHHARTSEAEAKAKTCCDKLTRAHQVSSEWRFSNHEIGEALMLHARFAYLAIVGPPYRQSDPVTALSLSERIIQESGRPTLMLPTTWDASRLPRRIVIGWNGSREATRIIAGAMPFLVSAESVHLVVVSDAKIQKFMGEDPGLDISKHLARYGVNVELEQLQGNASTVLLERCKTVDADLLVIGAHSSKPNKLNEIIFGTVTKSLLDHVDRPMLL